MKRSFLLILAILVVAVLPTLAQSFSVVFNAEQNRLDITVEGSVEVYINGILYSPVIMDPTDARFAVGDTIVSQDPERVRCRSGAGTQYSVTESLSVNQGGEIISGPRHAEGYSWYQIRTVTNTCWVADGTDEGETQPWFRKAN